MKPALRSKLPKAANSWVAYVPSDIVAFYTRLLLGTEPAPAWRARLAAGVDLKVTEETEPPGGRWR
ncbi:MAG TPA: hypothetical protein VG013_11005 [Gemmataceae bacterium]|jgi:hypothetical protein|nr:hypothetical protein [Gemmataceae bacterium]